MNTKDLLLQVKKAYPEAIGFIILNEGQGVEVYNQTGVVLTTIPMATFTLMFRSEESCKC